MSSERTTSLRKRDIAARLLGIRPGQRVKLRGHYYRLRRGKLVQIPDDWVGRPARFCGDESWRKWLRYKRPRTKDYDSRKQARSTEDAHHRSGRVPRERVDRNPHGGRRGGRHPKHLAPRTAPGYAKRSLRRFEED